MSHTIVTVGRDPVLLISGPASGIKIQNQGIPAIKIIKAASAPASYSAGLAAAGQLLNGTHTLARNPDNMAGLDDIANGVNYYAQTADISSKSASSNVLVMAAD